MDRSAKAVLRCETHRLFDLPRAPVQVRAEACYPEGMGSSVESSVLAAQALAYLDSLHAFAFRLSHDGATAEDLVQETFARCLSHGESFEPGTNLKAWLFRILRNLYFDLHRREQRRVAEVTELVSTVASAVPRTDFEMERLRNLVAEDIDAALQSLPEEQRTVVLLDLEGFSEKEIAEILGCAAGTVKSRLARARAALREKLWEYAT